MTDNYYFVAEPIYCASGKLFATEILTQFTDLQMREDTERYFREMLPDRKLSIFLEQLDAVSSRRDFFLSRGYLCSINVDFGSLLSLMNLKERIDELKSLQFVRLEISESTTFSQLASLDTLMMENENKWIRTISWTDDFDLNAVEHNKALLSSVMFDAVKVDKRVMLGTPEQNLNDHIKFIKRNKKIIIMEGIENEEKAKVAVSHGADYLQGHFFPRVSIIDINKIPHDMSNSDCQ